MLGGDRARGEHARGKLVGVYSVLLMIVVPGSTFEVFGRFFSGRMGSTTYADGLTRSASSDGKLPSGSPRC